MNIGDRNTAKQRRAFFWFDRFSCAVEGGCYYWATVIEYRRKNAEGKEDTKGFYAVIRDEESTDGKTYRVDSSVLGLGIKRLREGTCTFGGEEWPNARKVWARVMCEDYDADDADIVIQAGLFGDVVYG